MASSVVSIIVPTRNRADSVWRLLRALVFQEQIEGGFEVVIAADGCSDGTVSRIRSARWPFAVHVMELPPAGPAFARNCGAALAGGDLLLFLDDDVEPMPEMLRAHVELHRARPRQIGLGYLPPVACGTGLFATTLRGWWEAMFDGPRRPGHRYSYRNLLSGHFSIPRSDFEDLGGFATALSCHEDWELGYRAITAGLQMTFLPAAIAWHHDQTDVTRSFRRKFDEGIADVQLVRIHPELASSLPVGRIGPDVIERSRLIRLGWNSPAAGDLLARGIARRLPIYEHWQLRFRWRAVLERLLGYWYWRGVATAVGRPEQLASLLPRIPSTREPEWVIDLAGGLPSVYARLDDAERRPRSVRLVYGSRLVGDIADEPGAEPLRSEHVRDALGGPLSSRFAWVLAEEREIPAILTGGLRQRFAAAESAGAGSVPAFAA